MPFFCHQDDPTVQGWIDEETESEAMRDELRKLAWKANLNVGWIGAGPTRDGDKISTSGKPLFLDSVYLDCDEGDVCDDDGYFVCSCNVHDYAAFIAAANPKAVLALLDAYDKQRAQLEDERAACGERLIEVEIERDELRSILFGIATEDPRKWDPEMRGQFQEWAQNRARWALEKVDASGTAGGVMRNAELRGRPLADGPA